MGILPSKPQVVFCVVGVQANSLFQNGDDLKLTSSPLPRIILCVGYPVPLMHQSLGQLIPVDSVSRIPVYGCLDLPDGGRWIPVHCRIVDRIAVHLSYEVPCGRLADPDEYDHCRDQHQYAGPSEVQAAILVGHGFVMTSVKVQRSVADCRYGCQHHEVGGDVKVEIRHGMQPEGRHHHEGNRTQGHGIRIASSSPLLQDATKAIDQTGYGRTKPGESGFGQPLDPVIVRIPWQLSLVLLRLVAGVDIPEIPHA